MPDEELSQSHLGKLHSIHRLGKVPATKAEIAPLIRRGLVEAAGPRGQFGMTYYRATAEGKNIARNVNLSGGRFTVAEGNPDAPPSSAPATATAVPVGHMRMKDGSVRKIARDS